MMFGFRQKVTAIILLYFLMAFSITLFSQFQVVSTIMKTVLVVFFVSDTIINSGDNKKVVQYGLSLFILFVSFFIGQYYYHDDNFKEGIIKNFTHFARFAFWIIVVVWFSVQKYTLEDLKKVLNVITIVLVFNSLFIFAGIMFNINLFQTYQGGWRFGYNGLFSSISTTSYLYVIVIYSEFFLIKKEGKNKLLFFLLASSGVLIGTKTLWLFLMSLLIFNITNTRLSGLSIRYAVLLLLISAVFIWMGFPIIEEQFAVWENIFNERGLSAAVLSYRNISFQKFFLDDIENKWGLINFLFGGADFYNRMRTEMMIIDLFHFWGLIGGAFYLYIIGRYLKLNFLRKIDHYLFIVIMILLIGIVSGNLFHNSNNTLFIVLLISFLREYKLRENNIPINT